MVFTIAVIRNIGSSSRGSSSSRGTRACPSILVAQQLIAIASRLRSQASMGSWDRIRSFFPKGVHLGRAARSGDSKGDKRPLRQFRPRPVSRN